MILNKKAQSLMGEETMGSRRKTSSKSMHRQTITQLIRFKVGKEVPEISARMIE